jgi:muramoyltetrapeptide carboxypeptidase
MKIAVVTPANGKGYINSYSLGVIKLEQLGFETNTKFVSFDVSNKFHSDSDEVRTKNLIAALNSDAEIIWCVGGGYGSAKLIPELMKISIPQKQKIFIGFSDITALHLFFSQNWGWNTIHGSMIGSFSSPKFNSNNIFKIIEIINGAKPELLKLTPLNQHSASSIKGKLTGGNLSVIQTSIGTEFEIETAGKIVILEDINEAGYKIDRMLLHLKQSKVLENAAAIIFGDFTFTEENSEQEIENINQALRSFADSISTPVFKAEGIGHGYDNHPFIYNHEGLVSLEDGQWQLSHV